MQELSDKEKQRYWVVYAGLFALFIFMPLMGLLFAAVGITAWLAVHGGADFIYTNWMFILNRSHGPYDSQLENIALPSLLIGVFVGWFLVKYLWRRLFIHTGYLSENALYRVESNQAPTEGAERWRVSIGYVIYLSLSIVSAAVLIAKELWVPSLLFIGLTGYLLAHAWARYKGGYWDRGVKSGSGSGSE